MLAVVVNTITVLLGSSVGIIFRKKIKDNYTQAVISALALVTVVIGLSSALETADILCVIICMALGTILGSTVTSILPEMVRSAMGIAIYGMFIAIIIPPSRSSRPVLYTVLLAAAVSCLFYYTPVLSLLSRGWVIILCAVGVSAFMAWRFPVKQTDESGAKEDAADA